ncbi:MAG: hypothetical protein G3M70_04575 [Candidatus Nitronauta litoralis]|uniref:Uncharacterized protein n=1 Tax=Candidatus Nitronauta litoralis TaxID=2705533 RepID=A0A7T0FZW6_9BACT|nr:MAG: hypothetical protein G3M70_04575 [Candidatus Nitronauta litoralis]
MGTIGFKKDGGLQATLCRAQRFTATYCRLWGAEKDIEKPLPPVRIMGRGSIERNEDHQ